MDVKLPRLGEGADTGTVVSIMVSEGDEIQVDQTLLELENEKAVAPIPSSTSGTVTKVHVKEGDVVTAGQVLVSVDDGATGSQLTPPDHGTKPLPEAAEASIPAPPVEDVGRGTTTGSEGEAYQSKSGAPPPTSPTIRKLARELGIDLTRVKGSQRGGRIVMADLKLHIQRLQSMAFEKTSKDRPAPAPNILQSLDLTKWGPSTRTKMSPLRRTIANRMTESWTTIPHVTQFDDADISDVMELRKRHGKFYEQAGARLTVTSFAMRAAVSALQKYPAFKTSVDYEALEIVTRDYYHIGVAVDTEAGLIAPVIRDVDKKNLLALSKELDELAERTRQRRLSMDEMQGATFTISNLGSIGGSYFTPIVNSPQVAVLGMGRGVYRPMVRDQEIKPRLILPLALSYDHRVIDGADGARFLHEIVRYLESFPEAEIQTS
jgi:pyruvate dehydrogenase E2 component (dihydrolipoamide acetyltransferase)